MNDTSIGIGAMGTPAHRERPLDGVWAPSLTPVCASGEIDQPLLLDHIKWLLANGCHGVLLFGTTGEAPSFSTAERMAALSYITVHGVPPSRLLVGTGAAAVPDAIALTRSAIDCGCTKVLMIPPFYFKNPSVAGVAAAYQQVFDAVNSTQLQVALYHFPRLSCVPVSHELITRLIQSHQELLIGLKDSSGNWDSTKNYIAEFPNLSILPGSEAFMLDALQAGAAGTITATANINPRGIRQIYDFFQSGQEAVAAQRSASEVRSLVSGYPLAPACKAILADLGQRESWNRMRPPLEPLSADEQRKLVTALIESGFELIS